MARRLKIVVESEKFDYVPEGIEAVIFTAEGDMRYALNNLQATAAGFGTINKDNVFKVCDQPHPDLMNSVIRKCLLAKYKEACQDIDIVFNEGYNIVDLVNTLTRVIQNMNEFKNEELRLNYLKEASIVKMRTLEGNNSHLQMHGFLSKLCIISTQTPNRF